jgi:hypothetical protein
MKRSSSRAVGWLLLAIVIAVVLVWANSNLNYRFRWLLSARSYKASVLSQPNPPNEQLKHIEWDGWGWAGQNTVVFLVFDPTDGLAAAARYNPPIKYDHIPCEVDRVLRMERQWYTVEFYTNSTWADCQP